MHQRESTAASVTAHKSTVSLWGDFIKSCSPELLLLNLLAEHMRPSMSPKANIRTLFLETVFVCRRTVEIVSFLEPEDYFLPL